ncbi:MAG TPA: MATE family efflux transporter [Gemmatimonadetes bacterium]|nr:MATE family efflux transporter [Gemmatimonadota bacterium]
MSRGPKAAEQTYDRSIVEGPIRSVVWKLAWPTMLQNILGGLQGIVDHAMVGNYVGFAGNAAIGVAWQIFLVVMVFISSLFTGMGVLVARFVGAREPDKVNRTVYQAFLTAAAMSIGVLAPLGYILSPSLLGLVNAAPEVQAEALQYLRIMFMFSFGMIVYFMVGGALRSAGDARTPLRLGIMLTLLNITLNVILIPGLGPIPAFGTTGAAMGTVIAGGVMAIYSIYRLFAGKWVVGFRRGMSWRPDFTIIRELFRFGIPTGLQGVAMNVGGVMLLAYIGSLPQSGEAQAAYVISYTQLFSLITWTSAGLLGATAAVSGQNLGAGRPERTIEAVHVASGIGLAVAATVGVLFLTIPDVLLGFFGVDDPLVTDIAVQLLMFLSVSGLFITVALAYTGGLQGTGDTKSPFYISLVSQLIIPIGICAIISATWGLEATHVWIAVLIGHMTRCALSVIRFRQGNWRNIEVSIGSAGT